GTAVVLPLAPAADFLHLRTPGNSDRFVTKFYSLPRSYVCNDTRELAGFSGRRIHLPIEL
ncbi:hypothetical protein AVDCRST_MAG84-3459, partial [uncultured Microcoleus sp.]